MSLSDLREFLYCIAEVREMTLNLPILAISAMSASVNPSAK
jgi:hypothetical protein